LTKPEQFGHGGDLVTAAEIFRLEPGRILDFSANINPLGPPPQVMAALLTGLSANIARYPDPACRGFKATLAAKLGLTGEQILVGNGAAECLDLIFRALSPQKVGLVYPSFAEYRRLAQNHGASLESVLVEPDTLKPSLDQIEQLIKDTDLVLLGHPNNPTGLAYTASELTFLLGISQKKGNFLVMDEAFIDFIEPSEQTTLLPLLAENKEVILVRSLTKFYAIPGLRLGYALAAPEIIRRLQKYQVTWSVNALALAAGEASLGAEEYARETRKLVARERGWLAAELTQLGLKVWPGTANFLLVRLHEGITAPELQLRLGRQGLLIRDCSNYPGLSPGFFRVAVRNRGENLQLVEHCRLVLNNF